MNELEKNIPDDFWRKAFEEASETPPPRVWDTIERRLDESDKSTGLGARILPLWGVSLVKSQPFVWAAGIAAAVALLLVGKWVMNTHSDTQSIAQMQTYNPVRNREKTPGTSPNQPLDQPSETVASTHKPGVSSAPTTNESFDGLATKSVHQSNQPSLMQAGPKGIRAFNNSGYQQLAAKAHLTPLTNTFTNSPRPENNQTAAPVYATNSRLESETRTPNSVHSPDVELLAGRPIQLRKLSPIQRIVWFRPAELSQEPTERESNRNRKEMWASVGVMPGAFNPSVSVRSVAPTVATLNVAATNQTTVSSRADFSMAYQAGAGVQLNERWSIESGVGYLSGHATVEAPAQSIIMGFAPSTSYSISQTSSNLYVDALRNSSRNDAVKTTAQASYDNVANNLYASQNVYDNRTQKVITNDYQYMQVPVQVGYQLRPRKRLSMALLGGLLTNIFVRNTVGNELNITAKDGIYRPVSMAATMGARFRYRPSGRWSASLAGVYQPALELGTQTNTQVQSRPTSTGMSFGLDYHFN